MSVGMRYEGDQRFHPRYKPLKGLSLPQRQILVWLFVKASETDTEGPKRDAPITGRRAMLLHDVPWRISALVTDWDLERAYREQRGWPPDASIPAQTFADGFSASLRSLRGHGHGERKQPLLEVKTSGGRQPKILAVRLTPAGMRVAAGQIWHGQTLTEFERTCRWQKRIRRPALLRDPNHPFVLDRENWTAAEAESYAIATLFGHTDMVPGAREYGKHLQALQEQRDQRALRDYAHRSLIIPRAEGCNAVRTPADERPYLEHWCSTNCLSCRAQRALSLYLKLPTA